MKKLKDSSSISSKRFKAMAREKEMEIERLHEVQRFNEKISFATLRNENLPFFCINHGKYVKKCPKLIFFFNPSELQIEPQCARKNMVFQKMHE